MPRSAALPVAALAGARSLAQLLPLQLQGLPRSWWRERCARG
jgi:hypothetical protein